MTNQEIISILSQWNFWQKKPKTGLRRPKYVNSLVQQKDQKEVSIVSGVRRSGKSTILLQTLEEIIENGTPVQNIIYVNFEEPSFASDLNLKFLLQIYDAYRERFFPKGKIYIALDEVHQVLQWEKFVRGIYDRGDEVKFYITDSSSHLLSKEYGQLLTGRVYSNMVYPLSFYEFLNFKNQLDLLNEIDSYPPTLRHLLYEYLEFGGFPQVVLSDGEEVKRQLLKEYYSAVIEKDIASRYNVRDMQQLKEFCLFAMTQNGLNISGYMVEKRRGISQPTVNNFLLYLNEVFLMLSVNYFSYSLSQQQKRFKKIFSVDTGIYNAVSFKFSENIGRVFENAVFLALKRNGAEVFYWQDKRETDLVVREGRTVKRLINVCWNLTTENKKREIAGLEESMKKFKLKESELITMGYEEEIETVSGIVQIKNFFNNFID